MQNITIILRIIAILMLLWTLAHNPYMYYQNLRWVVTGIMGYLVYLAYETEKEKSIWVWIFGIIAILFNPIIPIYLDRQIWIIIDLITAAIIFASIFLFKVTAKK